MKDEKAPLLTYEQALMELALLARRAGQLAQEENRPIAAEKLAMVILTVDRLRADLAREKDERADP
jgi:hypothetical protein